MKIKLSIIFVLLIITANINAQNRWSIQNENCIRWTVTEDKIPHYDHIEMSGQQISAVIRWGVDENKTFFEERSLVFPMLRTIPNNTHASLMQRVATDIPKLISINGLCLQDENVQYVELNGTLKVKSCFSTHKESSPRLRRDAEIMITRILFPSIDKAAFCEKYTIQNIDSLRVINVIIPDFYQELKTDASKGVTGSYLIISQTDRSGSFILKPKEELTFYVIFSAFREGEEPVSVNGEEEYAKRQSLVRDSFHNNLVLSTPDAAINTEFAFAKVRASESIYKTKGGLMHGPGGESYYAAIWANDQAEYVNPFFPYLGYEIGNSSALNAYRHFARFMNDEYKPIPSSIIAEGIDIWDGAGDRGDAAMIAYGAGRYALAKGDKREAEELWPLIEWCLEYCNRKLNDKGVVTSDSDELEGRFPSGDANLCTSSLYYDALISAAYLGEELNKDNRQIKKYRQQAESLKQAIDNQFGGSLYSFDTYKYYDTCSLLRSWICIPLTVGILDRAEGTVDALFSDYLWHDDGLLTQQGSSTYWDRSTLYALRGIYIANQPDKATQYLDYYSNRRLLGDHVPYPVEAYPEGSQRHLSAESGLYCRIITEGLFGIRPTGLHSFTLTPHLPSGWNEMKLEHIRSFENDFDIIVKRVNDNKLQVIISKDGKNKKYNIKNGEGMVVNF